MTSVPSIIGLMVLATVVNIPLGYLRQYHEKFTFPWYFYIHISIPAIVFFRVKLGFGWEVVPFTIGGAVIGQVIGGIINRKRHGND